MSKATALIIDDEKNIRLTLSKCLSFIDVEAEEAINGEEGLEKIKSNTYDIIFLDLKMPGMNGIEVLKKIKEEKPDTSVVIITAHGTVDSAVEAMKLGAADFMQKPFTPQEIREIVEEILSRKDLNATVLETPDSYLQYAKDLITKRDYDGAVIYLKKTIEIDSSKAEPYNVLGAVMEIKGEYEEAKRQYKAALSQEPGYLPAQSNLIRVNKKIRDKPAAEE
jgi:DNA-binding NtrC family response regulator